MSLFYRLLLRIAGRFSDPFKEKRLFLWYFARFALTFSVGELSLT